MFTWFAPKPLLSRAEFGKIFLEVADELNMPDKTGAFICAAMCAFQEAGNEWQGQRHIWVPGNWKDPCFAAEPDRFPHDSIGDDGLSVGPFQQQTSTPGSTPWGWGGMYGDPKGTEARMDPRQSTRLFMAALKKSGYNVLTARTANDSIQRVQRSGFPTAYEKWWTEANKLYAEAIGVSVAPKPKPDYRPISGWAGDPVWLPEVLRDGGLNVKIYDGAMQDGHGDFGDIWGVVWHHTGGYGDTPSSLSNGNPNLAGPVCNLFIEPDGTVWLIAIGVAWHAGYGIYPGIPENGANQVTIGIECLHNGIDPWPKAQYEAMVKTGVAITKFLQFDASRNIAHKEWAGADNPLGINKQGKWDPGNFDMRKFRKDIQKRLGSGVAKDEFMANVSDQDAALIVEAAKKVLAVTDGSKRGWPSRSIYRDPRSPQNVVDDTVGMLLNVDGSVHELRTEHGALLGFRDDIERVRAVAEGRGAETTSYAVGRAKSVLARVEAINRASSGSGTRP